MQCGYFNWVKSTSTLSSVSYDPVSKIVQVVNIIAKIWGSEYFLSLSDHWI